MVGLACAPLGDGEARELLEMTKSAEELVAEMQIVSWFARQWERTEEAKAQWALEEVCFCSLLWFALFVQSPVQTRPRTS